MSVVTTISNKSIGSAILGRKLLVLKFYLIDVLVNACETDLNHGLTEGIISKL